MKFDFTPELIAKAKSAKSEAELLALAKENGIELTEEQAKEYFEQLHKSGELSDEELDNVAGGGCGPGADIAQVSFQPGTRVRVITGEHTGKCGTIESYSQDIKSAYDVIGVLGIRFDDGTSTLRTHRSSRQQIKIKDFGVEII